ncbi:MAG: Ig-like domain-containing protein, partial [Bacteroidota bacterium]
MNIFLHKKQFLLLFLLYLYFPLAGQQVDTVIYANPGEPINFSFSHFNETTIGINVLQAPSNGDLVGPDVVIDAYRTYEFTYQPNPDFLGLDIFTFTRASCPAIFSCIDTMVVLVDVREPSVDAKQDIAFAMLNSGPVEIDVLKNDLSESGDLEIANIPMVNNGKVIINPEGKLFFQPTPGFQGIASFNYNACNDYGTCDMATVNIVVNDVLPGETDTLRIFTSINEPIPIITPSDYNLDQSPENGIFEQFNENLPLYTPDNDFVGKDYISFSYGAFAQTVEVNVMNYLKNQFLVNDKAYVTPGQSIEIDIFSNDELNGFPCLESLGQPKYGSITIDQENSGILTYRAPANFVGIDEFEYSAKGANCQGAVESAKVSVFVSKYEPAAAKYEMSTPKMTPLVIGYYVPIQNFELNIKQQPRLGKLQFLAGKVDTLIYGRQITGENLMIYWPSEDIENATDDFEVTYCLKGQTSISNGLDLFSLDRSDC